MKIAKFVLISATALVISNTALSDTLTIATQNENSAVIVNCNGKNGPDALPANGSVTKHWWEIYLWFGFTKTLQCTFTETNTNTVVGTASLLMNNDINQAMITSEQSSYQVKIDPADAVSKYEPNIQVTLIKP